MATPPGRRGRGVSLRLGAESQVERLPEPHAPAAPRPRGIEGSTDVSVVSDFLVETMVNLSTQLLTRIEESVGAITTNERAIAAHEKSMREFQERTTHSIRNLIEVVDAIAGEVHDLATQVAGLRRDSRALKDEQLIAIAEAIADEVERRQEGGLPRRRRPLQPRFD